MPPKRETAVDTIPSIAFASVTSATTAAWRAAPPGRPAATALTEGLTSTRTWFAPRLAKSRAIARPMPAAPPVTIAVLPVRSNAPSNAYAM